MRALLPVLVLLCALRPALAAPPPALLEVWINGQAQTLVLPVTRDGGHLFVAASDAMRLNLAARLAADAQGRIDLAHAAGLSAQVDEAGQRLLLTASPAALPRQFYDLTAGQASMPVAASDTGAMLHYDLSAGLADVRRWNSGVSAGADGALDIFTPNALVSVTGFVTGTDDRWRGARLDSAVTFADPQSLSRLVIGDAIAVTPDWGRAVRFGGVEWASDFGLRPGLVTQPLPAFFGQSEVPATVDVFSGAAKLYEQDIAPGPFELSNLPVITGGGSATIVTRDVLGRETTQAISLYTDAGLLAPGLQSYAVDAGFLRARYGQDSFGYDTPILSGNWRRGLSDIWTVEAHGEAAPGVALLGGGAEWGLGFGSLAADVAASGGDHAGTLASVSAHALAGQLTLYAQAQIASRGWRDLASLMPGENGTLPARLRYQFGLTADLQKGGTLGISWLGAKQPGANGMSAPARELLSASWSVQLPDGAFAALSALRDFSSGAVSAQMSFNIPLGAHGLAGVTGSEDNGHLSAQALYDDPADPDGGFGYRLTAGWQDGARFQGQANWIGDRIALDGGVAAANGAVSLRADAAGALVWLRGSLFAAHDPGGAVALVEAGAPDIHIYRENRPVAVSDANGEALLTGLNPWAPNHIAVESRDYDFDTLVEKTDAILVPRGGSGLVADFAPASRHPMLATITRGIALATPLGARVLLDGSDRPLTLGRDGQVFIADLQSPRGAVVALGTTSCRVFITPQAGHARPLLCLREAGGAY